MVLARNDVDVDSLIRIGRQRRVVGVSYATEKRAIEYLDPELETLAGQFQNALAGKPLIEIVGASADEKQLLLIASSDTDPGMLYLYDKGKRELSELLALRASADMSTPGDGCVGLSTRPTSCLPTPIAWFATARWMPC